MTRWSYANWIARPDMITTSCRQLLFHSLQLTPWRSVRFSTGGGAGGRRSERSISDRLLTRGVLGRKDMVASEPRERAATTGPRPGVSSGGGDEVDRSMKSPLFNV